MSQQGGSASVRQRKPKKKQDNPSATIADPAGSLPKGDKSQNAADAASKKSRGGKVPNAPVNSSQSLFQSEVESIQQGWPGTFGLLLTLSLLTLSAFITRFYRIEEPNQTVFDEVHFGGFTMNYYNKEHFFDIHPPLGKLLFAAVARYV